MLGGGTKMKGGFWSLLAILSLFALEGCKMPTIFTKRQMDSPSAGIFEIVLNATSIITCDIVVGMPPTEKLQDEEITIEIYSKSKSIKQRVKLSTAEKANWLSSKGLESIIVYSVPLGDFGSSRSDIRIRASIIPQNKNHSVWICYTSR